VDSNDLKRELDAARARITALEAERDALRAEVEALKKCASCGKPLSRDCPTCKHLWET
jgi:cell division protein FtsB